LCAIVWFHESSSKSCQAVAAQVAFDGRQTLKPGYHFIGSTVETRRFQACGSTGFNLYSTAPPGDDGVRSEVGHDGVGTVGRVHMRTNNAIRSTDTGWNGCWNGCWGGCLVIWIGLCPVSLCPSTATDIDYTKCWIIQRRTRRHLGGFSKWPLPRVAVPPVDEHDVVGCGLEELGPVM
jgi:hypothetical protein